MINKKFKRADLLLSLCGLNCSLCPMFVDERCSGCHEGSLCYQACQIAPCSIKHGNIDYCFECKEYPCDKYDDIELYDSLITHRNQKKDLEKAKTIGIENYHKEQLEKKEMLNHLLNRYTIADRHIFFCLAVNLLEVDDLKQILKKSDESTKDMDLKQKSDYIKHELDELGKKRNIILKLNAGRY
ncbi:MAG: DUF3795 domain-containing protein [Methanobrevibacter sp.]|nr:DUF3795 domain-containing protein [Methanobrevibacter sp.]